MILHYFATLVPFLILDAIMLNLVLAPAFAAWAPHLMAPFPALLPAAFFYLGYPAGLITLVTGPALKDGTSPWPRAAILGATAYGTYELTAWSILVDYPAAFAVIDLIWGTILTTLTAILSLALTRRFGQM